MKRVMKNILIIGGTRNLGYALTTSLLEAGHRITILNRGKTKDDLPDSVMRLHADRTDPQQMRRALMAKSFDVVVDFVVYKGDEARYMAELMQDKTDHYIFISSGQVYLVREDIVRPFSEADYDGRLQPMPKEITFAYEEWQYGMGKRNAEDALTAAWQQNGFPFTSLRLPMVNSHRDHFNRLYHYILRLKDGGPLLIPQTPRHPLRHVYSMDVVRAILALIERGSGRGEAYNISQDETVSLEEFLQLVGDIMGVQPEMVMVPRSDLTANGFLPDCSPFSEHWMSELTNQRSKDDLNMTYTPLPDYLTVLVEHYLETQPPIPPGYRRRQSEITFARQVHRPHNAH